MDKNLPAVQSFLTQLNWKVQTDELSDITELQLDVYKFKLSKPLTKDEAVEFTEFLQKMNMAYMRTVMMIWLWLYQRDIKFKLVFSYNPRINFKYNMKNIFSPRSVNKTMLSNGREQLMACPLGEMIEKYGIGAE